MQTSTPSGRRSRSSRPTLLAVAVAGTLALAGCGTTVPLSEARTVNGASGGQEPAGLTPQSQQGSTATAGAGTFIAPSGTRQGTSGLVPQAQGGSSQQRGSGTTTSGQQAQALPRGITATAVKIGLQQVNSQQLQAFAGAMGANASVGNVDGWTAALVTWVNRHGGLAGRSLTPVYYEGQVGASNDTNNQAACSTWAEDNHVYLAYAFQYESSGAVACLRNHGVISAGSSYNVGSSADFAKYRPYYYTPSSMESVSMARSYVKGLHETSFFKPNAKIGLLYFDFAEFQAAVDRGIKPTLASYGLKLSDQASIPYHGDPSEAGNIATAVSNAELKFATEGISEVLFLDAGGTIGLFYMQAAQQQHRTFEYGFNSTSDASFLEGQNNVATQLAHATVVGTKPAYDTNDLSSAPRNPDRDRCFAILKAAGFTPGSTLDRQGMTDLCAFFFFVKAALDRATSFDPSGFARAVASLGSSPGTAAASVGDAFGPDKPWGGAAYGIATWRTSCSCFKYTGSAHPS